MSQANPQVNPQAKPKATQLAEWFWTDRWMGSSGFLLPLEARGLYREMLTQAWRRGARLPNNHEAIRRAVGATEAEWARCWPLVSAYWREDSGDLVNDTQLEVYEKTRRLSAARAESGARGGRVRAQRAQANSQANSQAKGNSLSLSPKDQEQRGLTKWQVGDRPVTVKMHALICKDLGDRAGRVQWDRVYGWADRMAKRNGPHKNLIAFVVECARDQLSEGPPQKSINETFAEWDRELAEEKLKKLMAGAR
jgi:uncharacterized protein YdaU (DUF1376 family)